VQAQNQRSGSPLEPSAVLSEMLSVLHAAGSYCQVGTQGEAEVMELLKLAILALTSERTHFEIALAIL
jgi:hypothetical protein